MRRLAALLLAFVLALAGASSVMAASGWTLTLTPTTIAEGQQKVFNLRATNTVGTDDIGCVKVTVPAGFTVQGAAVTGTSVGGGWQATEVPLSGGKTLVEVFNEGGGAKLEEGDWVSFTITATAVDPDNVVWKGHVTQDEGCQSPILAQINHTVTVQAAATPPPTPAPTPPPTPAPTPPPTPGPTIAPTAPPISTPTPGPGATPIATAPLATPTPAASIASPGPSLAPASPTASESPLVVVAVGPGAGPAGTDDGTPAPSGINPSAIVVAFAEGLDTPGFGAVSLLGDGYAWLVPTFVAGVPGLLIVLIILIQLLGGMIWTPSIRRLRSDPERAKAPPKPGS